MGACEPTRVPRWFTALAAAVSVFALCATIAAEDRTSDYVELVHQYSSDPAAVSRRVLEWSDRDLRDVLRDLDGWMKHELPSRRSDGTRVATRRGILGTAAVMHLHAARHGRSLDDLSRHVEAAQALWRLGERAGDLSAATSAHRRFLARGHALACTIWLGYLRWPEALAEAERAWQIDPQDPQVLLALGSALETSAVIAPRRVDDDAASTGGNRDALLSRAADAYGAALARSPDHTEARLRRARVLNELGRSEQAASDIDDVQDRSGDGYPGYWALMIRGSIHEAMHRGSDAVAVYRRAHGACRGCQSASVALSHALLVSGERQAAVAAIEPVIRTGSAQPADPWRVYHAGQWYAVDELLAELSREVPQ